MDVHKTDPQGCQHIAVPLHQPYIDLLVSDLLFTILKSPMKIALRELYLVMKTNSK